MIETLDPAIARRITADSASGCWLWQGGKNGNGYGRFRHAGRLHYAHRLIYQLLVGPIPDAMQLDHLCRNTLCVNPAHLEPVTQKENGRRGIKGDLTTHCPNNHPYDLDNTRFRPNGHRVCRTCHRERERVRKSLRRAA